jgi:hypothetical protein
MVDVDFFVLRKVVFDNPAKSRAAHGLGEKAEEEEVIRRPFPGLRFSPKTHKRRRIKAADLRSGTKR